MYVMKRPSLRFLDILEQFLQSKLYGLVIIYWQTVFGPSSGM